MIGADTSNSIKRDSSLSLIIHLNAKGDYIYIYLFTHIIAHGGSFHPPQRNVHNFYSLLCANNSQLK